MKGNESTEEIGKKEQDISYIYIYRKTAEICIVNCRRGGFFKGPYDFFLAFY
jgi:hypothetical protein